MGALTQKQTDRLNELDVKEDITPEEKKELNVLQKIQSGEDTDADNENGDNNPASFDEEKTPNEESKTDKANEQMEKAQNR